MRSAWVLDGRTHPRQVGPRVPGPAGRSPRRGPSAQAHSPDEAQGGSPVSVRVGHLAPRGQYGRSSRSIAACGSRPASPDAASYTPASSRAVPSSRHTHNVNVVHDELPSFVCRSASKAKVASLVFGTGPDFFSFGAKRRRQKNGLFRLAYTRM